MPVYRYAVVQPGGVSVAELTQLLPDVPTSVGSAQAQAFIDIDVAASSKSSLDDVLSDLGYVFIEEAPTTSVGQAARTSLGSNPISEALGTTANPTHTLATYAVIPEMTIPITTFGGNIIVDFNGDFTALSLDDWDIAIFLDAVESAKTRRKIAFTATFGLIGLLLGFIGGSVVAIHAVLYGVAPGAHTVDVRWRAIVGTARANGTRRSLYVQEA